MESGVAVYSYLESRLVVYSYRESGVAIYSYLESGVAIYSYLESGVAMYSYLESGVAARWRYLVFLWTRNTGSTISGIKSRLVSSSWTFLIIIIKRNLAQ